MKARTAFAEGLGTALLVLVYGIGPISGCHVNPAVIIGFLAARRITLLGADGYGKSSMIGANAAGAFVAEVVLTFVFVFVILAVTRRASNATVAGLVIVSAPRTSSMVCELDVDSGTGRREHPSP